MKLKWLLALGTLLVLPSSMAYADAKSNSVVIALPLEPPGLDPTMQAPAAVSEVSWENVLEGLTRYNAKGELTPGLALSWRLASPNVYEFKLRPGVKFHDGEPFTSADVKFSFERNVSEKSTNKRKRVFANIEKIETPDPLTVLITLKNPSALFPFDLAESTAGILSPKSAEGARTKPIGTGPYKFARWVQGDSVEMERYGDYVGPVKPTIDKVTFRFMPDENSQVLGLRSGQVDYVPYIAAVETIDSLKKGGKFKVTQGQTQGVLFLGMNNKKAPFTDIRVRRAMYSAIDAEMVNEGTHGGFGLLGGAQTNKLNPYFVDVLGKQTYDPEKAKKAFAEAGHPNGFTVNLRVLSNPSTRRTAEILVAQLSQVGVTVNLEVLEPGQWIDNVFRQKNYDMTIISHPEPWAINNYTDPNYFYQYDGPEFRKLMQEAQSAPDETTLRAKLEAAQKQLFSDAPVVWMYAMPQVGIVNASLNGTRVDLPVPAYPVAEMSWAK